MDHDLNDYELLQGQFEFDVLFVPGQNTELSFHFVILDFASGTDDTIH